MVEISFIFITLDGKKKFGKYVCDYLSDDHEGLDNEIKYSVVNCWNLYLKSIGLKEVNNINNIKIGVIGVINNGFCSEEEILVFDMYIKCDSFNVKYYVDGKELK